MFNLQPFLDLINSKDCTHEYNILNFSDLKKVDKTFFKNTKYQSEKNTYFFSKRILVPMSYICIIYVLDLYYIWKKHTNAWFSWVLLGFLAPAAIFVCVFLGFCWVFWRPRRFLYVFFLAFVGFLAPAAIFVCAFASFC